MLLWVPTIINYKYYTTLHHYKYYKYNDNDNDNKNKILKKILKKTKILKY